MLGFEEDRGSLVRPNGDDYSLASLFAQLLKLSDEDVLRLLALAMAETLAAGTATAELAGAVTGATLNDWRPDDTFFDLLNGKDVVNALLSDTGSPAIAEGNKAEPAKVQKGIIKDIMLGQNGRDQNADWLRAISASQPRRIPTVVELQLSTSGRAWQGCSHPAIEHSPPTLLAGLRACFSLAPQGRACAKVGTGQSVGLQIMA